MFVCSFFSIFTCRYTKWRLDNQRTIWQTGLQTNHAEITANLPRSPPPLPMHPWSSCSSFYSQKFDCSGDTPCDVQSFNCKLRHCCGCFTRGIATASCTAVRRPTTLGTTRIVVSCVFCPPPPPSIVPGRLTGTIVQQNIRASRQNQQHPTPPPQPNLKSLSFSFLYKDVRSGKKKSYNP